VIPRSPAALETVGLTLRHRRRTLLDACSLRVPRGSVCGLVGPNGAGKSLLLSAAAGLVGPQAGTITVLGRPAGSAQALPDVGFVDQHRSLYRRMSVAELLDTGRRTNVRWHPERARELLDLGRVPLGSRVGTLSGGQRTLVALALARGKAPRLMLLDEPLADLDPLVRRAAMGLLLADVADEGVTVLLSTHILTDLDEAVDHLVLLDGGRVRLAGELPELLAAHRYLDRDPGDARPWPGRLVEQTGVGPGSSALVRLEPTAPGAAGAADRPTLEELVVSYLRSPGADRWLAPGMRPDPQRGVLIP
jgi:ABC-2 type transport system ATP-binding protein